MHVTAEGLTAIGTLALAIVALYTILRARPRELYWRPEWGVRFVPGRPDCNRISQDLFARAPVGVKIKLDSAETHYVRARIHDVSRVGADDVEVSVVEVRKRGADHVFTPIPLGTPSVQ